MRFFPRPDEKLSFPGGSSLRVAAVLVALALLCLSLYGHTIDAPFVYDDLTNITKNPHIRIRELTPSSLAGVLKSRSAHRPLANFTLALNYYLHGYRPAGYHVFNWLIHVITGLLVYLLTRQTLPLIRADLPAAPFLAAALWLANPVHTQSVTYIVQRMNALAAMFYLASLVLYIRARTGQPENNHRSTGAGPFFFLCAVSGICALAAKQTAITLPVMIFLYEWFFIQDLSAGFVKRQRAALLIIAAAVTVTALIYLKGHPLATIMAKYQNMPFTMGERLLTQPRVICHYLSLLFLPLPQRLNIDHTVALSRSLADPPATALAIGFLLVAAAAAVAGAGRNRLLAYSLLWFLITLSVESSFIGLELMYEHRTYLPSVFLFIAVTCGLMRHVRPAWLAAGTLILLIAVSGWWTRQRNAVWADEIRFWQDAIAKSPASIRAYNNLGRALALKGRYEEGLAACRQAIALAPPDINTARAYNNIAGIYQDLGDNENAIEYARRAIQIDADLAEAYLNLGEAMLAEDRLDEAVAHLKTSLDLAPWLTPAYTLLARAVYRRTGDAARAAHLCHRALAVDPDALDAESLLGAMLQQTGDLPQALVHLHRVLDVSPAHPRANLNAGIVYNKLDRPQQAVVHLTRAVSALPGNARAQAELGSALMAVNRLEEAQTHFVRALNLSPDDPDVLARLATIKERRQQFTEAIFYFQKALAVMPRSPYCLNQLAVVLAATGQFDEAAAVLEELEQLLPDAPTVSFNLACLYALQDQPDRALKQLEKALKNGYNDRKTLQTDPDLDTIRDTPDYQKLINAWYK